MINMLNMLAANYSITVKTHRMTIAQMFHAWNDACKADNRPEMQLTDLFRFTRRDQIIAAVRRRRIQAEENFEADHAEALRMNEGIDLAFKIASLLDDCKYGVEGAMHGALIRDGYDEIDYLVQVAARKMAQEGTAEITAHGI